VITPALTALTKLPISPSFSDPPHPPNALSFCFSHHSEEAPQALSIFFS
jgi:hypothetical protein